MADDIVTRLRQEAAQCNASPCDCQCPNLIAAADEIERLRAEVQHVRVALLLAVEELFTHRQYEAWTHEMLFNQFLEEARRG